MVQTFVKRPLSPLHFEPLQPKSDGILWPGSEDEASERERCKKKLRVEILGKQYLDGRPLFIQTAGLRGPFEKNWVNPWSSRNVKRITDDRTINKAPRSSKRVSGPSQADTNKRKSIDEAVAESTRDNITKELEWETPVAKRRRNRDFTRTKEPRDANHQPLPDGSRDWLKTDTGYMHSSNQYDPDLPSPTPAARLRSRPLETSPLPEDSPTKTKQVQSGYTKQRHASSHIHTFETTPMSEAHAARGSEVPNQRAKDRPLKPAYSNTTGGESYRSPEDCVKQHSRSKSKLGFEHGDEEVNSMHQGAVGPTEREQKHRVEKWSSREAPARLTSPSTGNPKPSRLAPYVSDIIFNDDSATSAGFKATSKASRQSPCAVPPSTYLPEFKYHYTCEGSSGVPFEDKQTSVRGSWQAHTKTRSMSTSSSGSSDFAEAFEAAQAKANPGSLASSYSSSPIADRPETKSVRKNTQAMRRLTFTASGEPRISRPASKSSNVERFDGAWKRKKSRTEGSGEHGLLQEGSTKSLKTPFTDGNLPQSSALLAEAQVISNAPVRLVQVPSGPSTNLLETDVESPRFIDLTEEDSYLNLSTQAAILKAQRAFQDDLVSPSKTSPTHPKEENISPTFPRTFKSDFTPITNTHGKRAADHRIVKQDPEDALEPMSTQEIADGISPFAVTTVKRQPQVFQPKDDLSPLTTKAKMPAVSPDPSPTIGFRKPFSMTTTPSTSQARRASHKPSSDRKTTSKPTSSLTSFSMLPNGSTSEHGILQDGQQPRQDFNISLPSDPFGTPFATADGGLDQTLGSSELQAAIEEATSFLGDWDVEAETRRESSSSTRKVDAGPKPILAGGKRSL